MSLITVYAIYSWATYEIDDDYDRQLVEQTAEKLNEDWSDYCSNIDEARTEAGREALKDLRKRGYHREEAYCGEI